MAKDIKKEPVKTGKKSNRRMKKQVRRTIAGLFMASAIAVAAIPVEQMQANSSTALEDDTTTNVVRTVHYTDSNNNSFETIDGSTAVDADWDSKVPYIDITTLNASSTGIDHQGDAIYVDDTKSFQFAYVPEKAGSVERTAVVVGIQGNAIKSGYLEIPANVSAYRQYNVNSGDGSYCAVTGDGSYLYYTSVAQRTDSQNFLMYSATIYTILTKPAPGTEVDGDKNISDTATKKIYIYINPSDPFASNNYFTDESGTVQAFSDYNLSLNVNSSGVLETVSQTYEVYTTYLDEYGVMTGSWNAATEPKSVTCSAENKSKFSPCYLDKKSDWTENGEDKQLYYWTGAGTVDLEDTSGFTMVNSLDTSNEKQRIHDVSVQYIGMQSVKTLSIYDAGDPTKKIQEVWTVTEPTSTLSGGTLSVTPENGVFYGNRDLQQLNIVGNLKGIGDYAFYKCTGLSSMTLNSKINTIANGAFYGCTGLSSVSFDSDDSNLAIIGASAFENCTSLSNFKIPHSLVAIGDRAFKGDYSMTSFDMNYDPTQMNLNVIGYNAFENCYGLTSLEFPNTLHQKLPAHYLKGCTGLQYVKSADVTGQFDIVDGDPRTGASDTEPSAHTDYHNQTGKYCDIDEWMESLPDSFYFEANDISALHQTAKDHSATFLYDDTDLAGNYEIVATCDEPAHHESTYVVNTEGDLIHVSIDPACGIIKIPAAVGQYGIKYIKASTFSGNCSLKRIYIPASVESIESGAFKGCHNLTDVIFTSPVNPTLTIGDGAFDTQDIVYSGSNTHVCANCSTDISGSTPKLSFSGKIDGSYAPFDYAMNPDNNINMGYQSPTYITYYSGWPTFLTVRYNPDRQADGDENELIEYPTQTTLTAIASMSEATALDTYPYLTKDNYTALKHVMDYWTASPPGSVSLNTEDEQTCANSIYDLTIPYGVESIKEGLFSNLDSDGNEVSPSGTPNTMLKSVSLESVKSVEPYTFANMTSLESFDMTGGGEIWDYAFDRDSALKDVNISGDVYKLGTRPFRGCSNLYDINFLGSNFVCDDAIIYGLTDSKKTSVIECLETRGQNTAGNFNGSTTISGDELADVNAIALEAFMGCDHVETIELGTSGITSVPERAFAGTSDLYLVTFPESLKTINKDAFLDSNIRQVKIPNQNTQITDPYVFGQTVNASDPKKEGYVNTDASDPDYNPYIDNLAVTRNVTIYTPKDSGAWNYAELDSHPYINPSAEKISYKVYFYDKKATDPTVPYEVQTVEEGGYATKPLIDPSHDGYKFIGWYPDITSTPINGPTTFNADYDGDKVTVTFYEDVDSTEAYDVQVVPYGGNAATPKTPSREGYTFLGWFPEYTNVIKDLTVYGKWEKIDSDDKFTVRFINYDNTVISEQKVAPGGAAQTPTSPTRSGYKFKGWLPKDYTNITHDLDVYAQFEKNSSSNNNNGNNNGNNGGNSGGNGGNSGGENGGGSNGGSSNTTVAKYTVTVVNGSGSGTYEVGTTVIITANEPAKGKAFSKWTTGDVTLASTSLSATTFKMPAKNVTVSANYVDSSNTSSGASYATGNSGRPYGSGGSTAKGETAVVVAKNGVSNVDIASATVKGSTDSFMLKVVESNASTNEVEIALNNRYGSLDNIEYWACDISLYDANGSTMITDTTGLTVDITLPIPDELRQYGGNNMVAAVSNNQLETLSTKFNTVNGTPVVTFTATHFSPYVIYVDKQNLNASQFIDSSPKTGDPIHPKWFLAIGLAAASIVLFLKKDKKRKVATA